MKRVYLYFAALLALVLTTACEQEKWSEEQPKHIEVLEFYGIAGKPETTIDLYTTNRNGKRPLMIVESLAGIESYNLLDYSEDKKSGEIEFRVESVELVANELQFVATYKIIVDTKYGFAKFTVTTTKVGAAESTTESFDASYRSILKLN